MENFYKKTDVYRVQSKLLRINTYRFLQVFSNKYKQYNNIIKNGKVGGYSGKKEQ